MAGPLRKLDTGGDLISQINLICATLNLNLQISRLFTALLSKVIVA